MAKTDFLTADMTRRQFMKISGKSLAGLTLSASMLSLFGCSQKQVDAGAVATWALPQGLLVVNADLCTGCQRCEINCTLTNDGVCSSYISRVKIQRRLNLAQVFIQRATQIGQPVVVDGFRCVIQDIRIVLVFAFHNRSVRLIWGECFHFRLMTAFCFVFSRWPVRFSHGYGRIMQEFRRRIRHAARNWPLR